MSVQPLPYLTPEQYLTIERAAPARSEYLDGEMFAMAGASRWHTLIVMNVGAELRDQLRKRPCTVHATDLRVKVSETGLYTYPDLVVVCGNGEYEDHELDTLLNPTVLIEVLSPSTEAYDRGTKFHNYQSLSSLQEYVLICQDRPQIEWYTRLPDGSWQYHRVDGLQDNARLSAIGCDLLLTEVYQKVEFEGR